MKEKLVLDLETQREFSQVEGRKPELLGISVVGVYSYSSNQYDVYLESQLDQLATRLQSAEITIGYNINRFDMIVLQPYVKFPVSTIPTLDILEEIVKSLGHRVSLDSVAKATLGVGKSASGLDALKWFKEGRFDLITKYCLDDVKLTKEVYDYGKTHGRLFATSRYGDRKLHIPVFWPERKKDLGNITKIMQEAHSKRMQVEIEYLSQSVMTGDSPRRLRRVDIYSMHEPYFEGYCHFRNDVRQFRIDRVLNVKPVWSRYTIPYEYVPSAMTE